jgi:hypothetical protein
MVEREGEEITEVDTKQSTERGDIESYERNEN